MNKIVFNFIGKKRSDYKHWWVKLTLGVKDYTHQPIISLGCNLSIDLKKKKIWKDLSKSEQIKIILRYSGLKRANCTCLYCILVVFVDIRHHLYREEKKSS